jgi:hypothetical protein
VFDAFNDEHLFLEEKKKNLLSKRRCPNTTKLLQDMAQAVRNPIMSLVLNGIIK